MDTEELKYDPFTVDDRNGHIYNRYVWHPAVHADNHEQCHYILLRLVAPRPDSAKEIRQQLALHGIISSNIYRVYGYFDILIRFWTQATKRHQFIEYLKRETSRITTFWEFQAHEICYLWAMGWERNGNSQPHAVGRKRVEIKKFHEDIARQSVTEAQLQNLVSEQLIIEVPQRPKKSIKFYFALDKVDGAADNAYDRLIYEQVAAHNPLKHAISIYQGFGFADFVIKFVVEDFDDITRLTSDLSAKFFPFGYRAMTLVVADQVVRETDMIDFGAIDLPRNIQSLVPFLSEGSENLITQLPRDERLKLEDLAEKYIEDARDTGDQAFDRAWYALLEARLREDPIAFAEKLSVLLILEGLLRQFFIHTASASFGAGYWVSKFRNIATEAGLDQALHPVDDYTLQDWLTVVSKVGVLHPEFGNALDARLGSGWKKNVETLRTTRNDLAHGKAFGKKYLFENWAKICSDLVNIAKLYNSLNT